MLKRRVLTVVLALAAVMLSMVTTAIGAQAAPSASASARCRSQVDLTTPVTHVSTLQDIRLGRPAGEAYNRVVLNLDYRPANIQAGYVPRYVQDGSGHVVALREAADFKVRIEPVTAHTDAGQETVPASHRWQFRSWASVREVRLLDDFEAVVGVGIGLTKRVDFRVFTLTSPNRVVIDFARPGTHPWNCNAGAVKVYFLNQPNFESGQEPYFTPVWRRVKTPAVAGGALHVLFHWPNDYEAAQGLRFINSAAYGFTKLSISNGVARVHLVDDCDSGGSTATIAGEIMPTLKQFRSVRWVKIYDPWGHTQQPNGQSDSIPGCLEP